MKYKVRREIVNDFVENDVFDTKEEAQALVNKAYAQGIWDSIEMWEI